MKLSVVISTLGNYSSLRRVLDGYERQDAAPGGFEVLVVADAADSDPAAVEDAIGERPYSVRRLSGERPGLSANRNAGWRAARTPLVLFTDNDTIPTRRLVAEHISWHEREPAEEVAVLGLVRWSPEVRVTPFMLWLDQGIQFDFPHIEGTEAGWGRFYGANVSAKREFVARVGGFDEERLPYGYEDLDFGYRASKLGLRVLYNRDAVVDHLREMDLDFWKKRARRAAFAERQFVRLHPELPAYFHELFASAAAAPPARGRGAKLIGFVPRSVPWLGPRAWAAADLYFRQQLAPYFLEAWEEAGSAGQEPARPDLSELSSESSGGRSSSGPK
jgi:GT2 family glycosyltransferase